MHRRIEIYLFIFMGKIKPAGVESCRQFLCCLHMFYFLVMCCFLCCLCCFYSNTGDFEKKAKTPKSLDIACFSGFLCFDKKVIGAVNRT